MKHSSSPALFAFTALAAILMLHSATVTALPAGYHYASLPQVMSDSGQAEFFDDAVFTLGTAVNNKNFFYGYRYTTTGTIQGHEIRINNAGSVTQSGDWNDFAPLSAGNNSCFTFLGNEICQPENSWGLYIGPNGLTGDFVWNDDRSVVPLADSLPFAEFPGNLVEENNTGIIASTQVSPNGWYSVIFFSDSMTLLPEVPLVTAINDNTLPQVLGYRGNHVTCASTGCAIRPKPCEDDELEDKHHHFFNGSHRGHLKCHCHDDDDHEDSAHNDDDSSSRDDDTGATLIETLPDNQYRLLSFPARIELPHASPRLKRLYPVALNNTTALLRGSFELDNDTHDNLLMRCDFDPALLDANDDTRVDCLGGLQLVGDLDNPVQVDTSIGFSLKNSGLLTGNYRLGAADTGLPFVMDLSQPHPAPTLLSNLINEPNLELNLVTDVNDNGMMTGYAYRDCSLEPEGFVINPLDTAQAPEVLFAYSSLERNVLIGHRDRIDLTPTVISEHPLEFRTRIHEAGQGDWELLSDWHRNVPTWRPRKLTGEYCIAIEARIAGENVIAQQQVIRFQVDESTSTPVTGLPTDISTDDLTGELVSLGACHPGWLLLTALLFLRRSQQRARTT